MVRVKKYTFGPDVNVNMTSLQGYFEATYEDVVEQLGPPTYVDPDPNSKVNVEWAMEAKYVDWLGEEKVTQCTVYNWKDGNNYGGSTPYRWHVGGRNRDAVDIIRKAMGFNDA